MIFKDKSVLKSFTFWGAMVAALVEGAKQGGLIEPGFASQAAGMVQAAAAFLATIGLRRAVSNG